MKKNKYFDKLPNRRSCPCCNTKDNFKKERRNRIKSDTENELDEAMYDDILSWYNEQIRGLPIALDNNYDLGIDVEHLITFIQPEEDLDYIEYMRYNDEKDEK